MDMIYSLFICLYFCSNSKARTPGDTADSYNGAVTDRYTWSQTSSDLDIKIPVPAFVKKSNDIAVEIRPDSIKVFLKNQPPPGKCLYDFAIREGEPYIVR